MNSHLGPPKISFVRKWKVLVLYRKVANWELRKHEFGEQIVVKKIIGRPICQQIKSSTTQILESTVVSPVFTLETITFSWQWSVKRLLAAPDHF